MYMLLTSGKTRHCGVFCVYVISHLLSIHTHMYLYVHQNNIVAVYAEHVYVCILIYIYRIHHTSINTPAHIRTHTTYIHKDMKTHKQRHHNTSTAPHKHTISFPSSFV